MLTYRVLSDAKDIRKAQQALEAVLRDVLPQRRTRTIGWPSGQAANSRVRFEADAGESLWWSPIKSEDGTVSINFFGIDDANAVSTLHIKTQFNFPVAGIHRLQSGVFLEDVRTGQLVLANRGRMSRGKGAAHKSVIFRLMKDRLVRVADGDRETDVLRIAALDSPSITEDLKRFCVEARRASEQARLGEAPPASRSNKRSGESGFSLPDGELGKYFEEFFGSYRRGAAPAGEAACHHGDIVRQLKAHINDSENIRKSREVDLAIQLPNMLVLFEVKTAVTSQSVYTGIGQLVFHGVRLAKPGETVKRFLVLPMPPTSSAAQTLDKLGIDTIHYERTANGTYRFTGLDAVLKRRPG